MIPCWYRYKMRYFGKHLKYFITSLTKQLWSKRVSAERWSNLSCEKVYWGVSRRSVWSRYPHGGFVTDRWNSAPCLFRWSSRKCSIRMSLTKRGATDTCTILLLAFFGRGSELVTTLLCMNGSRIRSWVCSVRRRASTNRVPAVSTRLSSITMSAP